MSKKLLLKKAKVPFNIILKLAFKNMGKKWLRYVIMFIICTISLTFLSFTIELNGEKLRQNVYTMVENGYKFTEIYEHVEASENAIKENYYNTFLSRNLSSNSSKLIKEKVDNITIHEFASKEIPYTEIGLENKNYFFTGKINTLIKYDETNNYTLLAGRCPNPDTKEILITDYLVNAFIYFKLYPDCNNIYDFINLRLDLGVEKNYIIVGIIKTNFDKWSHFAKIESVESSDKENYAYSNDLTFMNSVILNYKYFKLEKSNAPSILIYTNSQSSTNTLGNWKVTWDDISLEDNKSFGITDKGINIATMIRRGYYSEFTFGRLPIEDNEIVIPYSWIEKRLDIEWSVGVSNQVYSYTYNNFVNYYLNYVEGMKVKLSLGNNDYEKEYTIVGVHNYRPRLNEPSCDEVLLTSNEYQTINSKFQSFEKILVELPEDGKDAYKLFNRCFDQGYVLNVWAYSTDIDSYVVDPFIDIASKAGLFIFAVFTMGIMWTIISIEIVDSKKEIGILRSIGLSSGKVSLIFVIQTAFIIILSYLLSIYLSYNLIPIYNSGIMDEYQKITLYMYSFTYRSILYLGIFVVCMTLISTLIPLIKIMSNKIIDVINERDS